MVLKRGTTVFPSVLPTKLLPIPTTATPDFNIPSFIIFHPHFPSDFTDHRTPLVNIFQNFFPNDCPFVKTPDREDFMSLLINSTDSITHLTLCAVEVTISVPILPILSGILKREFLTLPNHLPIFVLGGSFFCNSPWVPSRQSRVGSLRLIS